MKLITELETNYQDNESQEHTDPCKANQLAGNPAGINPRDNECRPRHGFDETYEENDVEKRYGAD